MKNNQQKNDLENTNQNEAALVTKESFSASFMLFSFLLSLIEVSIIYSLFLSPFPLSCIEVIPCISSLL